MKEFPRNDDPEVARAVDAQQLLFPTSPRSVCVEIGLEWWTALKLRDDGWLSYDPETIRQLNEAQDVELRFLASLVTAGCDPAMLERLLLGLKKPYSYRMDEIYYDWRSRRWRALPLPDAAPETLFSLWIASLKDDGDKAQLREVADEINAALAGLDHGGSANSAP